MPLCPHCGAQVQREDIVCGNCGRDLRDTMELGQVAPVEPVEEGEALPMEDERREELLLPSEALPGPQAPAWISPTSRTLWIVVAVVLLTLLCCCGVLSLITVARILNEGPLF